MANLSPTLKQRFFTATGDPLAGGKLFSYQAGTTTPLATYTDQSESSANANPIILDANGECNVWLGDNAYKFVLKDSSDVTQWTVDNVNQASENLNISSNVLENFGLTASASLNALTITVTNGSGGVPSALNPVRVGFRSPTLSSGLSNVVNISSSLGMTLSAGSTLGHSSGVQDFIFVYLIYNNGAAEVAVSGTLYPEFALYTTVAEGGTGSADTRATIYSVTARTNVPMRLVGRMTVNQATAGNWATLPSQIQAGALDQIYTDSKVLTTLPTVQRFTSGTGTYNTPANVRYLVVEMCGGGGGGGGGGNATPGSNGSATTFGTSFLTASGGAGAATSSVSINGGAGGGVTVNAPALTVVAVQGGQGSVGQTGAANGIGGIGGANPIGGAASGGAGGDGANAINNTGGGGGGGSTSGVTNAGHGGGAGGYIRAIIPSPASSYAYSVGTAGGGQVAGAGGYKGGNGGAGVIVITEYYS